MICYYFPPCRSVGALRSGKFVKYLGRFGWHSEVLTAYRGRAKEYEGSQDIRIHTTVRIDLDEVISKLVSAFYFCWNFVRKRTRCFRHEKCTDSNAYNHHGELQTTDGLGIATYLRRWLLLPDGQAIWILSALPKALWLARKCDVVYSSLSPFSSHVLGIIVKKLTGKPWVADYRDPWSLNSTWKPPTKLHKWLGEKLDKACVKNADTIITPVEVMTRMFVDHFGGPDEKFITVPNGYDKDDVAKFREFCPPKDTFVMTSIGSLYGGRDPKPFLRAAARLVKCGVIERQKLNIKLIGGQNPDLIREVKKLKIADIVQIVPRIPQEEALMALAQSHISVLVGSEMEKVAMTTKAYEYTSMGKVILALVPQGPLHDFVSKAGGWCVDVADEEEISKVVANILERHKRGELESYHQPEFIKRYERCTLTKQLAHCFDSHIR